MLKKWEYNLVKGDPDGNEKPIGRETTQRTQYADAMDNVRRTELLYFERSSRLANGFTFRSPSRKYIQISPFLPAASGPFALSKRSIFFGHLRRASVPERFAFNDRGRQGSANRTLPNTLGQSTTTEMLVFLLNTLRFPINQSIQEHRSCIIIDIASDPSRVLTVKPLLISASHAGRSSGLVGLAGAHVHATRGSREVY